MIIPPEVEFMISENRPIHSRYVTQRIIQIHTPKCPTTTYWIHHPSRALSCVTHLYRPHPAPTVKLIFPYYSNKSVNFSFITSCISCYLGLLRKNEHSHETVYSSMLMKTNGSNDICREIRSQALYFRECGKNWSILGGTKPMPPVLFSHIITLKPRQNGCHFTDDIFSLFARVRIFSSEFKCHQHLFPRDSLNMSTLAHIMAWQRLGDKPLPETMFVPFT